MARSLGRTRRDVVTVANRGACARRNEERDDDEHRGEESAAAREDEVRHAGPGYREPAPKAPALSALTRAGASGESLLKRARDWPAGNQPAQGRAKPARTFVWPSTWFSLCLFDRHAIAPTLPRPLRPRVVLRGLLQYVEDDEGRARSDQSSAHPMPRPRRELPCQRRLLFAIVFRQHVRGQEVVGQPHDRAGHRG